jgi:hypothetical protein
VSSYWTLAVNDWTKPKTSPRIDKGKEVSYKIELYGIFVGISKGYKGSK